MAVTDIIERNQGEFVAIGLVATIIGAVLLTGVVSLPSVNLPFAQGVGQQAVMDTERTDQRGFSLFKTVGSGTDTVEFESTFEHTASFSEEYVYRVFVRNPSTNEGSVEVLLNGIPTTVEPGESGSLFYPTFAQAYEESFKMQEQGDTKTFTPDVGLIDPVNGDTYEFIFEVRTAGGSLVATNNKVVNVKSGTGTLSTVVIGAVLSTMGLALASNPFWL